MTSSSQGQRQAIRARMAKTGEPYSVARRAIEGDQAQECLACRQHPSNLEPVPADSNPYGVTGWKCPDCPPLRAAELGVAELDADATPEQKARAEALWRAVLNPDRPCRCSGGKSGGPCRHGQPCADPKDPDDDCPGRVIHYDRHADGMLGGCEAWTDTYLCPTCRNGFYTFVELPNLPWGRLESRDDGSTAALVTFPDIRHPNFTDTNPGLRSSRTEPPYTPDNGGHGPDDLMCGECRLTWKEICPECPGCACVPPSQCSGWRHGEWAMEFDYEDDQDPEEEEWEYAQG